MLIDSHCHLDVHNFDADREEVLQRALQAGVEHILVPAVSIASCDSVLSLISSHPNLHAAIGIHPEYTSTWTNGSSNHLRGFITQDTGHRICALGEIGLDYYWDTDPHPRQQYVLEKQLELAAEVCLPVVIHFREKGDACDGACAADLLKILDAWTSTLRSAAHPLAKSPGVLHAFSGNQQTALQVIDWGFFLGIGGPVTHRKVRQDLVASLPLDRMLVETDAPYLAPVPHRGRRNEPAFVRLIADKIALLHQCNPNDAAEITSANARRLFSWDRL